MSRLSFFPFLLTCLLFVVLTSCNKDEEEQISPNLVLLTGGTWQGAGVFVGSQDFTDEFENQSGFDFREYSTKFERDGTYTDFYQSTSVSTGTWEFINNEQGIIVDKETDDELEVTISKLTETEFNYITSGAEFRMTR